MRSGSGALGRTDPRGRFRAGTECDGGVRGRPCAGVVERRRAPAGRVQDHVLAGAVGLTRQAAQRVGITAEASRPGARGLDDAGGDFGATGGSLADLGLRWAFVAQAARARVFRARMAARFEIEGGVVAGDDGPAETTSRGRLCSSAGSCLVLSRCGAPAGRQGRATSGCTTRRRTTRRRTTAGRFPSGVFGGKRILSRVSGWIATRTGHAEKRDHPRRSHRFQTRFQ